MTQLLSLGAINVNTGQYEYPKIANKKEKYICPDCNKDLILCKGEIKSHHFRHKVDNNNPCNYFNHPTESQIHKDAKFLLKKILETNIPIELKRKCYSCKKTEEFEIPPITESSIIELEYRFDYNGLKIADVAYIDNKQIIGIFEICNTHKTCSENRPEPWFEIDAKTLIKNANNHCLNSLQIDCIRCEKCENCILNGCKIDDPIEKYVRFRLGQKSPLFNSIYLLDFKLKGIFDKDFQPQHSRFDFDAKNNFENNKKIIDLFENDFKGKKIIIYSAKGIINLCIFDKFNYKPKYWDYELFNNKLKYECNLNCSGMGTVEIITNLIKYFKGNKNILSNFTSIE